MLLRRRKQALSARPETRTRDSTGSPAATNALPSDRLLLRVGCGTLLLLALCSSARAQYDVTLAWDPSPDPTVAGYRLYYGVASGTYTNVIDAGNRTSATASNLVFGVTYYFAVTAYDASGVESLPSNEVSYEAPSPPIQQPEITGFRTMSGGGFSLTVTGKVNQSFVLLGASNLAAPIHWTPIATYVVGSSGLLDCRDFAATNFPQRFYRIQVN